MKHALIDSEGKVVNLVEVEPGSGWTAGAGHSVVWSTLCAAARIGDTWNGAAFIPSPEFPPHWLAPYIQRCREYVLSTQAGDTADQLNAYLANATPTAAESVAALKETIRTLRSLIRIVRSIAT